MAAPNPTLRAFAITVTPVALTRPSPLLSITITSKSRYVCASSEARQTASASSHASVAMAMVTVATLFAGPTRYALFEKRRNAFLCVLRQRVHRHHFFGVSIRFGLIEIDLGIERLLTQADGEATGIGD